MWRKGKHIGHPHYTAQELLQDWAGLWTQPQHATAIQLWKAIKAHAGRITDDLEQITMEDLERGLKLLKTNTAVGIDQWSPGQLRSLSQEAKEVLLDILRDIEKAKAWPGYVYYNIIVLMGKPAGGVRPIALMAMIDRLWTKIRRPYIVQWERAHAGPWDAAIKGSSALRAGILSALNDEIAVLLGNETLSVLFDM